MLLRLSHRNDVMSKLMGSTFIARLVYNAGQALRFKNVDHHLASEQHHVIQQHSAGYLVELSH